MEQALPNFESPFGETALAAWYSPEFIAGLFRQDGVLRFSVARAEVSGNPLSWEELMQVKRDCGFGDYDAVEVYPKDSDIFNTGNIRHLYFIGPLSFALRQNIHVLRQSNPHG